MKYFVQVFIFIYLLLSSSAYAQCDGNVGANIFEGGDFGSGTANVLANDPQIAPGYQYLRNPPPNDGMYTITNNTTSWGMWAADAWDNIGDNSSDPNGYMMVVNASFEPGLFYEQTISDLCDNTTYVFSTDVYNLIPGSGSILPNISFLLDDVKVYETGNIVGNRMWNTYGFTFTTDPGQTSLKLSLQNNAPGGTGNDLALDNISFRVCGPDALILPMTTAYGCEDGGPIELVATIDGDAFDTPFIKWQQSVDGGQTWEDIPDATSSTYLHTDRSSGNYYYRYLLANSAGSLENGKCRIISNTKVVEIIPKFTMARDTFCEGNSIDIHGTTYFEAGVYIDTLLNFLGCDSIVTIDLHQVEEANLMAEIQNIDPSCHYTENGSIRIGAITGGTAPYSVTMDGTAIGDEVNNLGGGEYELLVKDYYGCTSIVQSVLNTPDPFFVSMPDESYLVDLGDVIEVPLVFSHDYLSLTISDEQFMCVDDCQTLIGSPTNNGFLIVEAISDLGCISRDTVSVRVEEVRKVNFPNIFSPNEDGRNEVFYISGSQPNVTEISQLAIYDRRGNQIFKQENIPPSDPSKGWDGRFKGALVVDGVYTFVAKVLFIDNRIITYSGTITVQR